MAVTQYIGARYVPKFADPILHDPTKTYEALEIVNDGVGDSYTSKIPVPAGIPLTDTTYWVQTGNFNSQLNSVNNRLTTLEGVVADIPVNKRVVLLGDSYVMGIGGNGLDIETEIESITGYTVASYYEQGCGYLRVSGDGKKMYDVLLDAIAGETDPELVTDVVLAASVYNDLGMQSDPSFTEAGFLAAIKQIVEKSKEVFINANISLIPAIWCEATYNYTYKAIAKWEEAAAITLGLNHAHNAINWLMIYDNSVDSGDSIHPNNAGYKIIAEHITCVINGKDPGVASKFGELTTATGDTLYWNVSGDKVCINCQFTKHAATPAFSALATLPTVFKNLSNYPITMQKYGALTGADLIATIIMGNGDIYLGSAVLDDEALYIIDFEAPVVPINP